MQCRGLGRRGLLERWAARQRLKVLVLQRDGACLREGVARRPRMAGEMGTDGTSRPRRPLDLPVVPRNTTRVPSLRLSLSHIGKGCLSSRSHPYAVPR